MTESRQKLSLGLKPKLKHEVKTAVEAGFESARGDGSDLADADDGGALDKHAQDEQLAEIRHLGEVLETGSSSLNQRATTLAGLAVAGIGTFGLFAGKLDEVHGADARQICAIALIAASFSLAVGAAFALLAVLPRGRWAKEFAKEVQPLIEGDLKNRGKASADMVQMQFRRNSEKALWMKRAYWSTGIALIAVFVALLAVAHEATGILT